MNQTDLSVQVNSSTHCILIISLFFLYEILKVHLKHKIQYIGPIRKLRLLHHGHSTNVLPFSKPFIEEQVLHERF